MRAPIIGITCGEITNRDHPNSPLTYGQSFTYVEAVLHAGGVPLLIPIVSDMTAARRLYDELDGVLFSGGNDIDPGRYHEKPHPKLGHISEKRDEIEFQLMDWSHADNKPLLAICRGMQLLNIYRGGTLYQDIPSEFPDALTHLPAGHDVALDFADQELDIASDSRLEAILGTAQLVANSYHHQAIKDVGRDLTVTAHTSDGIIEAIEDPAAPFIIGTQCHPESIESSITTWRRLFEAFTEAAAAYAITKPSPDPEHSIDAVAA